MSLSIQVGFLAQHPDDEGELSAQFERLSEILSENGHPGFIEPRELPENRRCSFDLSYAYIHYLRRLAAHIDLRDEIPPPGDDSDDPILARYFKLAESEQPGFLARMLGRRKRSVGDRRRTFDHLILHSDCVGFYAPVPFTEVIFTDPDPNHGGMIGSSHALADECRRLARALELPENIDPESEALWNAADSQGQGSETWQRYGIESFTCARLLRAAEMSIASSSAIVFC